MKIDQLGKAIIQRSTRRKQMKIMYGYVFFLICLLVVSCTSEHSSVRTVEVLHVTCKSGFKKSYRGYQLHRAHPLFGHSSTFSISKSGRLSDPTVFRGSLDDCTIETTIEWFDVR